MNPSRRRFITRSVGFLAAAGAAAGATRAEATDPPDVPLSMKTPGAGMSAYGSPARYEGKVTREFIRSQPGTTGSGASRTPLESLEGMITPSGLHFERHHSGVPDIDPQTHRLLIHGLVKRSLIFSVADLLRYPLVSRIHFLECSGNSQLLYQPTPPNLTAGETQRVVDSLAKIEAGVKRLSAALGELLDLAQLQAGQQLALHRSSTDLVALVQRLAADHAVAGCRSQSLTMVM